MQLHEIQLLTQLCFSMLWSFSRPSNGVTTQENTDLCMRISSPGNTRTTTFPASSPKSVYLLQNPIYFFKIPSTFSLVMWYYLFSPERIYMLKRKISVLCHKLSLSSIPSITQKRGWARSWWTRIRVLSFLSKSKVQLVDCENMFLI